jgi:hypothetical protein
MTWLSSASALVLPGSTLIVIVLAQQEHASAVIIGLIFAAGGVASYPYLSWGFTTVL